MLPDPTPTAPAPVVSTEADLAALLDRARATAGAAMEADASTRRPLHGTTLYLAHCTVDTRHGPFQAYVFQDIAHKGYLLALAHGDIAGEAPLWIRVHSSCVTSETLRGVDCDCLQQLDGALERIAREGRGLLFYLMQEGRGVGYVAKARDRMLVQASLDRLTTFEAYRALGLRQDHRSYENIPQIRHLLGIRAPFIVLTNNPDKVASLRAHGVPVAGVERLEYQPSPYNLAYLSSKLRSGHSLSAVDAGALRRALPPEPVEPFAPHALPEAQRFIHAASYWLPVRALGPSGGDPHWFRVHVYHDIVSSQEYVALTYGQPSAGDAPVVRLQSESLFNRFPLRRNGHRERFECALGHIVRHGSGVVLLLYWDGRGAGFGAYATDRMLTEHGLSLSSEASYRMIAAGEDSRDYDACMTLLRHHLPGGRVRMVMDSPDSLVRKTEYAEALHRHRIEVERWIFLEDAGSAS